MHNRHDNGSKKKENDLATRMTERQPVTRVLWNGGITASIETFVLSLKSVLRLSVSAKNPLPRKAENRQAVKKMAF